MQPNPKLTVRVLDFRPLERNTLLGFANVAISEIHLVIRDVAIHHKGERRWAQLPARAQLDRDHQPIRDEATGKIKYVPTLEFANKRIADAFSSRVVEALEVLQGRALA